MRRNGTRLVLFELGNHVDVIGEAVGGAVGDFEVGGVFEEVDGAHLDAEDVEAGALAEVGQEFLAAVGVDEGNLLIENDFGGFAAREADAFEQPAHEDDQQVGGQEGGVAGGHAEAVDDADADDDEEVGHFAHGHGGGAVADHAEDGEEAEGEADFDAEVLEREEEEVDDGGEEEEGEVVVAAVRLAVVEAVGYHPAYQKVEGETQEEVPKVGTVEEGDAEEVVAGYLFAEFLGDVGVVGLLKEKHFEL